jgi:antitoxin MazE
MKNEDDNLPHERVTKLLVDLKEQLRRAALERMARLNWTLPRGFKFDRDEANER